MTTGSSHRYLADRYRLEEVLGRGATGTVWAAYDEMLRRPVAVKEVPPPPGMPDAEADALRERTLREARSIAVLSHPNVVTLYDVVRQNGEPFVVMELLPATSLATLINRQGPLDVAGAALVGCAVASALQAAHEAGITHRDVKPGNVLIGTGPAGGRIKLTDFGIARNVAESTLTVTGMTLGSPAYIAPEVASGGQVGPAADLWGLGATLFAAVQGRPPYDGGDPLVTIAAVVNGEVPRATSAGQLEPVIAGLMVKDPARRMPLAEVIRALQPLLPPDGRILHGTAGTTAFDVLGSPATPSGSAGPPGPPGSPGDSYPYGRPAGVETSTRIRDDTTAQAPLAPEPGPLPFAPPSTPLSGRVSVRPARRRSAAVTAVLALAAVIAFAAGTAGGFGLSRWAAGAPLLPELAGTTTVPAPTDPPVDPGEALQPQAVTIVNEVRGSPGQTVETTFTVGVPPGWTAYRPPLGRGDALVVAAFVSPDGNRTITVDRVRDFYPDGTVEAYLAGVEKSLSRSVHDVVTQPVNQVGVPAGGATEGPFETSLRTVERGPDEVDAELLRTTLMYLLPLDDDLWIVSVTVPSDQQKSADALFHDVIESFVPDP